MLSRRSQLWLAASAILAGSAVLAATRRRPAAPLRTAPYVDLDRYLGRWYEIARLPTRFENELTHVTADYHRSADGSVQVVNRGRRHGALKTATGRATVADPATNARLEVRFFWSFTGDYWILELDPDYEWALVGEPSRSYLWILSRQPRLNPTVVRNLLARARLEGFPTEKIIFTQQDE